VRKEISITASSSLRSALLPDDRDQLRRRFVEAARRAQIVTIVNRAQTEAELGECVTAELCEVFEAEIGFVLARTDDASPRVVGAYGLRSGEAARLLDTGLLDVNAGGPYCEEGANLLAVGARTLACAPFGARGSRGVVGVARLYEQTFDEAEAALLEAVAESIEHALEPLWLAEERDRLYREAHERGQAARVIGSIADGVLLVDDAGVVQLWNPAAEAMTGLARDVVVGRPLDEAIPGWSAIRDSLVVASDPASSSERATSVPIDVGGREVWLSVRGVGLAGGTVYAFRDLTQDRRLEQLKTDFIATVSHELRTPLAAVHGAAKTLAREEVVVGGDVFRELLNVVIEQSDRLAAMVDDILLASRIDSPGMPFASEPVDVAALGAEVISAARAHVHERFRLELVVPPSPPPVVADRDKLRQVLTNLVANAVKYSPAGGRIELELKQRDGKLDIAVRDEGLGIASAEQQLIFEKFYRVDANMTRGVSGSGLGLYICRELVHRMDGRIAVESHPGEGSAFIVTLPIAAGSAAA
jgi:two-component system, OmpR family, phosphate regulon sensor histidine kinase PhoR